MQGDRPFRHLKEPAAIELAKQIESLEPNAVRLEVHAGMGFALAACLVGMIQSGKPDLFELKSHGLAQEIAVEIAEAIGKRHARVAAARAAMKAEVVALSPNAPKALPPLPYAARAIAPEDALSMIHTIFEMSESGRPACMTTLCREGWSDGTSKELARIIDAARPIHRTKKHV